MSPTQVIANRIMDKWMEPDSLFAPLPESLDRYIAQQEAEARPYVHATILNPGPNRSTTADPTATRMFRSIAVTLAIEAAGGLLVWLIVWASHRLSF